MANALSQHVHRRHRLLRLTLAQPLPMAATAALALIHPISTAQPAL